jgi:hypothetical protein
LSSSSVDEQLFQYCDFEDFHARCGSRQEVIVMHSASYGRRQLGRCLDADSVIDSLRQDPRYFGCAADVIGLADRKCSGRTECAIELPDVDFERATPCYKDSRKYFEARYSCVRGQRSDDRKRSTDERVKFSAVLI